MKKFRIVVRDASGRKQTRHVRASDRSDAERQAAVIAGVARPLSGAERAVLGAPPGAAWKGGEVLVIEEMGRA